MDWKTFIAALSGSLVWPGVLLSFLFLFKKQLSSLISSIASAKYKDWEIHFKNEILKAEEEGKREGMPTLSGKEIESLKTKVCEDPAKAIVASWQNLEVITFKKLQKIFPKEHPESKDLKQGNALNILLLSGGLPPKTRRLLDQLQIIRNQIVHYPGEVKDFEYALKYVILTEQLSKTIEGIREFPLFNLHALTLLILEINHVIDTGKYDNITPDEIVDHLEKGTIFNFLKQRIGDDMDLSWFTNSTPLYKGFMDYYLENMEGFATGYGTSGGRRKWGVKNKGLCLLLAWTNELIQQGSGWHPAAN